ncbi:MAG: PhnD/SsuA/transferrin family substrate-binding protein, partial [Bryobacterales bacterium]|nr:PhnD/SsuA/transferrin family substrate-binding protein [Bryobacterales bacterium]
MTRTPPALLRLTLLLSSIALAGATAAAQPAGKPLKPARLDMAFSGSLLQSANRSDATAALRVWSEMLGRRRGLDVKSSVLVVDDVAELRRKWQTGEITMAVMDSIEFLQLGEVQEMDPVFLAVRGAEGHQRYLLLTRTGNGIQSLAGLRGKSLLIHANTRANLGQRWIEGALSTARLEAPSRHFRSLETVPKGSAALLPVFFGKVDAAIVDEETFAVTREMNPQVGRTLQIIATSPSLVESIVCVSRRHEFR